MCPDSYTADVSMLPKALRDVFVELNPDSEIEGFLQDCRERPHTSLELISLALLSAFVPAYEAHGLLAMYPMYLLSSVQWKQLVPEYLHGSRLLDIGAGQGFVTQRADAIFTEIVTTETAPSMVRRLRSRGFEAHEIDIAEDSRYFPPESFGVVSILNVLDRCERPRTLLENALPLLQKNGAIIISDPLPLSQKIRRHGKVPLETLPTDTASWEKSLSLIYEEVIMPLGIEPVSVSRLPYVYKNTNAEPYVVLDDFVMVCKKI